MIINFTEEQAAVIRYVLTAGMDAIESRDDVDEYDKEATRVARVVRNKLLEGN